MTVSYNNDEMHGFFYEFQAILSANLCYCTTADRTLSFTSFWGGTVSVDLFLIKGENSPIISVTTDPDLQDPCSTVPSC